MDRDQLSLNVLFTEGGLLEFVCNENVGDVKHMVNR
jgi:hypothetical protein